MTVDTCGRLIAGENAAQVDRLDETPENGETSPQPPRNPRKNRDTVIPPDVAGSIGGGECFPKGRHPDLMAYSWPTSCESGSFFANRRLRDTSPIPEIKKVYNSAGTARVALEQRAARRNALRGRVRKLSIKDFHRFMRGPFASSIEKAYKSHHIFCEADLQAFAWREIKFFLKTREEAPGKFRVLNKPFLRDCGTYPDLVIFRRRTPWVVVELKESRLMNANSALKERKKLLEARNVLNPKRAYLVYLARYGDKRVILGAKEKGAITFLRFPSYSRGQ